MAIWLNGIFKDNMVFQWGTELRIFGRSDKQCTVRCALFKEDESILVAETDTEEDGSFLICADPVEEPGGPYEIMISSDGEEPVTIQNAYAGEVWLAAGETNMDYPLERSEFAKYIIPKIGNTEIRYYKVPQAGFLDDDQQKAEEESRWVEIDSSTAGKMSGVAFYFAQSIESRLDAKIGIIQCTFPNSTADCWQSIESLLTSKDGEAYIKDFDERASEYTPAEFEAFQYEFDKCEEEYKKALDELLEENPNLTYLEADRLIGPAPWPPPVGPEAVRHPGSFFDSMILRIAPYTLRGIIYYQGESDTDGHQSEYGHAFESLIREWREVFFDDELPFLFCQLPMYISKERKYMGYDDMSWPLLREQQQIVAIDLRNVYMAVTADCGEFDNLYPSDKKTPGARLALLAQKFVYGFENTEAVAPYIIDARRGEGVEVTFGGDYMLLSLAAGFGPEDSGFEVAGEDGEFFPAEATVDFDGKTILLSCPLVEYPSKVRYGFFSYGPTPLHAQNGLTATPFQVRIDKDLGGA